MHHANWSVNLSLCKAFLKWRTVLPLYRATHPRNVRYVGPLHRLEPILDGADINLWHLHSRRARLHATRGSDAVRHHQGKTAMGVQPAAAPDAEQVAA